jgi:glycosyltransferase involved in cell wall biosynthesis
MALYNRLDRWLLRRADRVVVMSEVMAQLFRQGGADPARVRVVHNAVDPGEFARRGDGTAFRVECGAGGGPLIGVIGRFSSEKGQAMLLRALPEIRRRHPAAKAVLVGDGIDRDRLQRLVRDLDLCDAVTFAGYRRDLSPVYAALDLVVLPSLSEGLPNVLLEAFVHRKPVVATAVGAVPDVMRGPLAQWLAPPGDPAALAHAVSSALSDPAGLEAAAAHGYQEARERFSPERRVERIVDLYQEVLGEPR